MSIHITRSLLSLQATSRCIPAIARTWCRTAKSMIRMNNTLDEGLIEEHRRSRLAGSQQELTETQETTAAVPRDYRFVFPEFLPNPIWYHRDRIREKLERSDMYKRRAHINLPEFYVGSILAVTVADKHAPGKENRFVGICIDRREHGMRAAFVLRNVVEGDGVEILYELYSPLVKKIEVLKLEKRLDEWLYYLRDSPPEYSYIPFDMEPVLLPKGSPIPLNTIKIPLNPPPWRERYELKGLKGVQDLNLLMNAKRIERADKAASPWELHDLMKQYRASINEVEADGILQEVHSKQKAKWGKAARKR